MSKKAHNLTLNPDVAEAFKIALLPRTKFRSLSEWLDNELVKVARQRAGELRTFKLGASKDQVAVIDRALTAVFATK